MKMFSKHIYAALVSIAVLSSCSRPVAYFQRGPVQHYGTAKTEVAPSVSVNEATPPTETQASVNEPSIVASTPTQEVAQAQAAITQLDAYVRNDSKLATDKKLSKRMDRIKSMLNSLKTKTLAAPATTASAKKMNLLERIATKHIDKKIKHKLSPKRPMATSLFTAGLILAAVGLLLILIGNGLGVTIGVIALVAGAVLVILELTQ